MSARRRRGSSDKLIELALNNPESHGQHSLAVIFFLKNNYLLIASPTFPFNSKSFSTHALTPKSVRVLCKGSDIFAQVGKYQI